MSSAAAESELLDAYRPVLQYDSRERYFADHPAVMTDRPGNRLCRADGATIATATEQAGLLELLHPGHYSNGQPVDDGDHIDLVGRDYARQAAEMHARADLAHVILGRVATDLTGGRWLQYWLFFYYDDPEALGIGTHEGDLEMIQIAVDADDRPTLAVYAQHRAGHRAPWSDVECDPAHDDAPVVYCAHGSHASLFRHGIHFGPSPIPDRNNAQGPRVRPALVELTQASTPWAWWPGRWGSTLAADQLLSHTGADANSPTAPIRHKAWAYPDAFAQDCRDARLPPIGQPHVKPAV